MISRSTLTLFAMLLSSLASLHAQTVAGTLPAGANVQNPNLYLEVDTINATMHESLDLDCDGQPDLTFGLNYGYLALDAPCIAEVEILHDQIEICGHFPWQSNSPQATQYQVGDALSCNNGSNYWSDTIIYLGWYGGFIPQPPFSGTDSYLAFRSNGNVGWVRLSYNIDHTNDTIFLQVDEVARYCLTNGMEDRTTANFQCYPNPFENQLTIEADDAEPITRVSLFNMMGKLVYDEQSQPLTQLNIQPKVASGVYLLQVTTASGQTGTQRIIRP